MSTTVSAQDAWSRLSASTLWSMGGVARVRLLDDAGLTALRDEATAHHVEATEVSATTPRDGDRTRGNPARWLESAPGGPSLRRFLHDPVLRRLLSELTGLAWIPSGGQGTYSYYRRHGHHLDVHRDIEICDLAVITCVQDDAAPSHRAGTLVAYPHRWDEPVDRIRATPDDGAVPVPLAPGESVVLLGGVVPHRLPPIGWGRVRVVAPLCFRVAQGAAPADRRSYRPDRRAA